MAWLERGRVVWVETTPLDPMSRLPIPTEGSTNFSKISIADPQMERYEAVRPMFLYSADYLLWGQGQP